MQELEATINGTKTPVNSDKKPKKDDKDKTRRHLPSLPSAISAADMNQVEYSVYDALPYAGTPITQVIEASAVPMDEPLEIITDIISAIEGKQVMIIGEMGTGKSTLAQYLAYTVGGRVRVYECEGTPTDWAGLEVLLKMTSKPILERVLSKIVWIMTGYFGG